MPAIPYVAIIEIAIPGEYFVEADASVNVMGITAAVPNPTKQNPSIDGQKVGKRIASKMPVTTKQALMMNVFAIPISSTTRSDANLDKAIQIIYVK